MADEKEKAEPEREVTPELEELNGIRAMRATLLQDTEGK